MFLQVTTASVVAASVIGAHNSPQMLGSGRSSSLLFQCLPNAPDVLLEGCVAFL